MRLYSRPGNDPTRRFPLIVETLARLRSRSCIIDGEAVACDQNGVASFDLVRHQRANERIFLYAFDLIELNGDDLRRDPLEVRKVTLASIVAKASPGIRFNEHMEGDGPTVFSHACKLGLEGVVSKRKDSAYRSGRSPDWLKMKNSDAPAVKREAEEGLGQRPVAMKKHRINAHPARRIYRKIGRIESGVRQKTFGSCDLIMEGETGDAKCLTPSTLAPPVAGLLFVGPLGTPQNTQSRVSGSRASV